MEWWVILIIIIGLLMAFFLSGMPVAFGFLALNIIGLLVFMGGLDKLRLLIMPDHPTPIETRTHSPDPVPFMLWGAGLISNGAKRFTEAEAKSTGFLIEDGYKIMSKLARI